MKKTHLFVLFLILQVPVEAQKVTNFLDDVLNVKYQTGYVILNNKDSLSGEFEFNNSVDNYKVLVYKNTKTKSKDLYYPQDVNYFVLDGIPFYPKEYKNEWFFMRLYYSDSLSIYIHKHFFTDVVASQSVNYYLFEKSNGTKLMVQPDRAFPFKARLTYFFDDCPALCEKINKNEYGIEKLTEIALFYNDWLRRKKQ